MARGYDRPRLQVLAGGRDLTERCDSLVFSAVDRGGYEIATLGLPASDRPLRGTPVTIRYGLEVAWQGRVAEIADHSQHGRATKTTGCEGLRALLKDNPMQMVYVDTDLSQWKPASTQRKIGITSIGRSPVDASVTQSPTSGAPALATPVTQQNTSSPGDTQTVPRVEAWYDAGAGNTISQVYYAWQIDAALAGSLTGSWALVLSTDDIATAGDTTPSLAGAGPGTGTLAAAQANRRFAMVYQLGFTQQNGQGSNNQQYGLYWTELAVYGTHGLRLRGNSGQSSAQGLYPSDIARHALSQCSGVVAGTIVDSASYIAPQVVYRTPVDPDQIIDDMAKLMGWSWGVWEPVGALGSQPRLDFAPPPPDATAIVTKAECDELDITTRLGDLYDTAVVTYTDSAGSVGEVSVYVANPALSEAGISGHRTLTLDLGPGSAAEATTFGQVALALAQVSARGAGQATLPASVRLPGGGSKPSVLLRPGIDRLRVVDLVDGGPLLELGGQRRDTFRISRVETTATAGGAMSTRVELDTGTNLLETLQARLAIAAGVIGSGASG